MQGGACTMGNKNNKQNKNNQNNQKNNEKTNDNRNCD